MNNINLSGTIISKRIDSLPDGTMVVNILLIDNQNPRRQVFKAALWGDDVAIIIHEQPDTGDELEIQGKVCCIGKNNYGTYIDIRQCKLISICKVERKRVFLSEVKEGMSDD